MGYEKGVRNTYEKYRKYAEGEIDEI